MNALTFNTGEATQEELTLICNKLDNIDCEIMDNEENGIAYHKNDKLIFVPLVGFNDKYSISDDIGAFAGVDTFNGFKIGFTVEL